MNNDHDTKTLNALIETVIDSADGYAAAAKAADGSQFTPIFNRRGEERRRLPLKSLTPARLQAFPCEVWRGLPLWTLRSRVSV